MVPVFEALSTGAAYRGETDPTTVAMVALLTSDTSVTYTSSGVSVALRRRRSDQVALARATFDVGVTPEVLLALVTLPTTEARTTVTGPIVLVTLFREATDRVTIAGVASLSARYPPVVLFAPVAVLPEYPWKTGTLSGPGITGSSERVGAQKVAVTVATFLSQSVSPKPGFARLAIRTVGVVETLEAPAGVRVAVSLPVQVRVVATVTGDADTPRDFGVTEVVISARIAPRSCVAVVALADYVEGYGVQGTTVGV